jgi:hypothetical protein
MKKLFIPALILSVILILYAVLTMNKIRGLASGNSVSVLLLYNPSYLSSKTRVLDAYESVLQEEGVPVRSINIFQLTMEGVRDLPRRIPAVLLPDSILQHVPREFPAWVEAYLDGGGNLLVVHDVGVKDHKGYFLERSALADITGFNTITYSTAGVKAYDYGHVRFSSAADRDFFQFPAGKTMDGLAISSYNYGQLRYPFARIEPVRNIPPNSVYAYAETAAQEKFPAIVLTNYAKGSVLYVNLPLGQLKAYADDLPLRAVLRTFLFTIVGVPHVLNVENGQGSVVINLHVDSNIEYRTIPDMKKRGLLREGIPVSFHISAGDFFEHPGDGAGFDACGKGRPLVELAKAYGTIGSHGGWAHNWFANNIANGKFGKSDMRRYILRNSECLEEITGYKIVEYSAPVGLHPQPVMTSVLEDLGFIAYYTTADTGSSPNRTFFDGSMVSKQVIAFPIMPFGRSASFYEMKVVDAKTERQVMAWLFDILAYTTKNRTTRLIYSHPYNIELYPHAVRAFADSVSTLQQRKILAVSSMTEYATFFLRFLKTKYSFSREIGQLRISLKNPSGLAGICIALPKRFCRKPIVSDTALQEDKRFFYLTMVANEKEKSFAVDTF